MTHVGFNRGQKVPSSSLGLPLNSRFPKGKHKVFGGFFDPARISFLSFPPDGQGLDYKCAFIKGEKDD